MRLIKSEPRVKPRNARTGATRSAKAKASLKQKNGLVGALLKSADAARGLTSASAKGAARSLAGAAAVSAPPMRCDLEAVARACLDRALPNTGRVAAATTAATDPGTPPEKVLAVAAKASGQPVSQLRNTPQLHYYFHADDSTWHLAYIVENVRQRARKVLGHGRSDAVLKTTSSTPATAHVDHCIGDRETQKRRSCQPAHRRREKRRTTSRAPRRGHEGDDV